MRRGQLFELRGGLWPSRGETRVDSVGEERVAVRGERRTRELRAETITSGDMIEIGDQD
jgi:hypothetical protein